MAGTHPGRGCWLELWMLCIRVHRPANLHDQDVETAKTMMLFSVLLALGLITMPGTEISRFPMGVSILVVLLWKWLFWKGSERLILEFTFRWCGWSSINLMGRVGQVIFRTIRSTWAASVLLTIVVQRCSVDLIDMICVNQASELKEQLPLQS